jgi:hypothetical protein
LGSYQLITRYIGARTVLSPVVLGLRLETSHASLHLPTPKPLCHYAPMVSGPHYLKASKVSRGTTADPPPLPKDLSGGTPGRFNL